MITVEQYIEKKIAFSKESIEGQNEIIRLSKIIMKTAFSLGDMQEVKKQRKCIAECKENIGKIKEVIRRIRTIGEIPTEISVERLIEIDKEFGYYDEEVDLLGWYGDVLALVGNEEDWEIEDLKSRNRLY